MRLIQAFVPADQQAAVRERLDELEISARFGDATDHGGGIIAYVPVPTGAVGAVLGELYDAGLDEDAFVVVTEIGQAQIPNADELTDRFVEGPTGGLGAPNLQIRDRARDLMPETLTYVAFAIASAVVAVGGLLLDSAIVIVGAMVIAPFAGSTLSASVGAVIGDREMVVDSASSQVSGLLVAYVGAVAMGAFLQWSAFVPSTLSIASVDQVATFVSPSLLAFAIAISAGLAGALALATDLPVSIAGVAVAAAIVPATATAGIGTVWGEPLVAGGAIVLLLMNIVFINLTAYVTLVALGYRQSVMWGIREGATVSLRSTAYALVVLLFAAVVVATAVGTVHHLAFERTVNAEVEEVLDREAYADLELEGVGTQYDDVNVLAENVTVSLTLGRTSDDEYGDLASVMQREIATATDRSVSTRIRFVDYQRARAPPGRESLLSRLLDDLTAALG